MSEKNNVYNLEVGDILLRKEFHVFFRKNLEFYLILKIEDNKFELFNLNTEKTNKTFTYVFFENLKDYFYIGKHLLTEKK